MSYFAEALDTICNHIQPKSILEFGSGQSTLIFAKYGKVTAIEYDPPGDWHGVTANENVDLRLIPQEDSNYFPKNLMETFFSTVINTKLLDKEDPLNQSNLAKGRPPKWDLGYIDGAVHIKGFKMAEDKPGWSGGDISYITRSTIAGMCIPLCKHVLIDDIGFLPMYYQLQAKPIGDRFFILSR